MFNLLRCLLVAKGEKWVGLARRRKLLLAVCISSDRIHDISSAKRIKTRARQQIDDEMRNTRKTKMLRHFVRHTQDSLACEFCFFFKSQSQKALDVVLCALFCLLLYNFRVLSIVHFAIPPSYSQVTLGSDFVCCLRVDFIWIFHRARQQQIHPTIETRMPCHTLCINI